MPSPPMRALLGFIAAAISVLTFHQVMWCGAALYGLARADDAASLSHRPDPAVGHSPHRQSLLLGRFIWNCLRAGVAAVDCSALTVWPWTWDYRGFGRDIVGARY